MNYSFRAYDTAKKQWIVDEFAIIGEFIMGGGFFGMHYSLEELNNILVERATLYKGRSGKTLFEGDIFKAGRGGKEYLGVVVSHMGELYCGPQVGELRNLQYMEWIDILGNIHDNPDMIPLLGKTRPSVGFDLALFNEVCSIISNTKTLTDLGEKDPTELEDKDLGFILSEVVLASTILLPSILKSAVDSGLLPQEFTPEKIKEAVDELNDRIIRK